MTKKHKEIQLKSFGEVEAELLEKKEFRQAYYKEDEDFELAKKIMRARIAQGVTQEELAKKIKRQQPSIARLESGNHVPSLPMLRAIAKALNLNLEVRFSDMREVGISEYKVEPQMEESARGRISLSQ